LEEEDYVIAKWAQEDVETLYILINSNNNTSLSSKRLTLASRSMPEE
jgi:hypothetical protein